MSQPHSNRLPVWHQPIGAWRARGASSLCIRVGLGLDPSHSDKALSLVDQAGYTVWHYWANSPRPHDSFASLFSLVGSTQSNQLAAGGEHPWHFLLLTGHLAALQTWIRSHGFPHEHIGAVDSFSHCAAWSGEQSALDIFQDYELPSINHLDDQGLSPLMIAIHRGNESFVNSFLMAGADPMLTDQQGRTALHHAAQYGDAGLVSLLEDAGGDANTRDHNGLSANDVLKTRRAVPPRDLAILREHWRKRRQLRLPF